MVKFNFCQTLTSKHFPQHLKAVTFISLPPPIPFFFQHKHHFNRLPALNFHMPCNRETWQFITHLHITCKLEAKLTGIGKEPGAIVIVCRPDIPPAAVEETALTTLDKLPRLDGLMTWMTFSGEIPPPSMMMRQVETEDEDEGRTILEVILGAPSSVLIWSSESSSYPAATIQQRSN